MRFASQRFQGIPRARAERGDYRDSARISGRAPRGDQGMEPMMTSQAAQRLGYRAPRPGAPGVPIPNPSINGNYRGPGIRTRLGGLR